MSSIERCLELLSSAKSIIISTHTHPDADGIGSQIALCLALKKLGKEVYCINEDTLLERYRYLDPQNVVTSYRRFMRRKSQSINKELEIDLLIIIDTHSLPRIGPQTHKLATKAKELLFIDHHPCPKELARIHCINTLKAASGELVAEIIKALNIPLSKDMALALYTAVLIDTSSFRYPTVTGDTHRAVGRMLDTGIDPPEAYNAIYGTKKVSYLKLLGIVLSHTQINESESVAWIGVSEELLSNFDVDPEDTHGFVNHLLILDQVKVVAMFRQINHTVKVSLRSVDHSVDVGIMAQAMGGGGHNHSAATIIEGHLEQVITETIKKIELMLGP